MAACTAAPAADARLLLHRGGGADFFCPEPPVRRQADLFGRDRCADLGHCRVRAIVSGAATRSPVAAWLARPGTGVNRHRDRILQRPVHRRLVVRLVQLAANRRPDSQRNHGDGDGRRGRVGLLLSARPRCCARGAGRSRPAPSRREPAETAAKPARPAHAVQHAGQPAQLDRCRSAARHRDARPAERLPARHSVGFARHRASAGDRVRPAARLP